MFEIERNALYRWFLHPDSELLWSDSPLSVQLEQPRPSRIKEEKSALVRRMKFSFPFSEAPRGCEFVYGAVVEKYPQQRSEGSLIRMDTVRKLIRFAYDYKNLRCESKDISLHLSDLPYEIAVQLIDTELRDGWLEERPRSMGISLLKSENENFNARTLEIEANEPFRKLHRSPHVVDMSAQIAEDQVEALFGPHDSFPKLANREIEISIRECQMNKRCLPIRGAISSIRDYAFYEVIEKAKRVGVPIDLVINASERAYYPGTYKTPSLSYTPWMWLRGNRELGPFDGMLQMHTKFLVFGDRVVLSSNNNITGETRSVSRGLTMRYTNPDVIRIFDGLYGSILTGIPYPYHVDRNKNFNLLLSFERPRRFVASAQRTYTPITTEEGVTSSAYGIFLEELARREGAFKLFMSPITDDCFTYDRRRCFLSELQARAKAGTMDLDLAGTFYLNGGRPDRKVPFWRDPQLPDHEVFAKRMSVWMDLRRAYPERLRISSGRKSVYTIRHERYGVIYPDTVMSGSANFVFPYSLNIVEVVKSPNVFRRVDEEIQSYSEPFVVIPYVNGIGHVGIPFKDCIFVVEQPFAGTKAPLKKRFSRRKLMNNLQSKWPGIAAEDLTIVEPPETAWGDEMVDSPLETTTLDNEYFSAWSSYLCVSNRKTGATTVVRIAAE